MNIISFDFMRSTLTAVSNGKELIRLSFGKEVNIGVEDRILKEMLKQFAEYESGKRKDFSLPLKLEASGTEFQRSVWRGLRSIGYGATCSYKDLAEYVGSPKAFQAIGQANSKNPFMIVVPCHRVIQEDGKLGGYAGGSELKKELLELEKSNE